MNKQQLLTEMRNNLSAAKERQTELAERYNKAYRMYRKELPEVVRAGDLPAAPVMWEAFESVYPSLVKLFTDNDKSPVKFDSDAPNTTKVAQAVTKAVHTAAMKVDGIYSLTMRAIKEILITGNQVVLVGYDKKSYESDKHTFNQAPLAELITQTEILKLTGYNIEQNVTIDEDNQTVTGWVQGKREVKYSVISLIDFKDFYLHPKATGIDDARYCSYAEHLTRAEAAERGYSEAKLDKADSVDTANGLGIDKTLMVMGDLNGDSNASAPDSVLSADNDEITVYHHFWRGCYNSSKPKIFYVIATENDILKVTEVDYIPLVIGGMSLTTGSAWSESLYDSCASIQISKTRALRAIQRSADNAAYGEYMTIDSMMTPEGRKAFAKRGAGASYGVKDNRAITKLAVNDVPQAMELLNNEISEQAEKTIQGSAGQAQALEENGQASGAAVALTQDKQELNENQIAACIAETLYKPMYKILLLVLQEMGNALPLEGVQIPFKAIRSDIGLSIDIETTYDRANAAANLMNMLNTGQQTGTLPANLTDNGKYEIYKLYAQAATGQEDVTAILTPPEQMPQPSKAQQLMQALITVSQIRSQVAACELAEAKVNDQKADTQKKYNEAAKELAQIKQILAEIDMDKVRLLLDAKEEQANESDALTKNAQNQEQLTTAA